MIRHPILFVGAGPGDPELITVRGKRALEEADLVVHAGSLVPEALLGWARPEVQRLSSAPLALEQIVGIMADAYRQGKRVVRLHSGDPSVYGAMGEQMQALDRRCIPYAVIPGVTAALAAAAAMNMDLTVPQGTQTLILTRAGGRTAVPDKESLDGLAEHGASMAVYLSASLGSRVGRALERAYGPEAPVAVAHRVSRPDQRILMTTVSKLETVLRENGITSQALILVGPALERGERAPSRLYDARFSHGFRKGKP